WHSYRGEYARRKFVQGYSGRPNITGSFWVYQHKSWSAPQGGFAYRGEPFKDQALQIGESFGGVIMDFSAKKSKTIYQDSVQTNQPASLRALALIRAY
uniref:hypothetical protein n=1 Tax=Turicimonas muris TaxID=1796652 RepID=UPI0025B1DCE0